MKVVLIRVGALVTVVVLGWIAIAQAQRGSIGSATIDVAQAGVAASEGLRGPPQPSGVGNPLRPVATTATPADTVRRPVADPFGLQAHSRPPVAARPLGCHHHPSVRSRHSLAINKQSSLLRLNSKSVDRR